jgi:hypothetical protein
MRPWHAVALFCEDIRDEQGPKKSLMGVLPDNLTVPETPGALPKLGIYVRINLDPSTKDVGEIAVKLRFADGTENSLGGFDADTVKRSLLDARSKGAPWCGFVLTALAIPFPVTNSGQILAVALVGDEEVVCGGLNILLEPPKQKPSPA